MIPLKGCVLIAYSNNKIAKFRRNVVNSFDLSFLDRWKWIKKEKKKKRNGENLDAPMWHDATAAKDQFCRTSSTEADATRRDRSRFRVIESYRLYARYALINAVRSNKLISGCALPVLFIFHRNDQLPLSTPSPFSSVPFSPTVFLFLLSPPLLLPHCSPSSLASVVLPAASSG